jgi:hypothetical protein
LSTSPHQTAFSILNFSTMPLWLAMIIAPRSKATAWLVNRAAPLHAAISVFYAASLGTSIVKSDERIDFTQLESVSRAFQKPEAMLAGWAHYITFDLFVGTWIWRRSLEEGRTARIALLLTWWAGPAGLGLFLGRDKLPFRLP